MVSEILIGSVEKTSKEFGFGEMFVGPIIVGIVGNAAEHSSAIVLARKRKMDLSIGLAAGYGTQVVQCLVITRHPATGHCFGLQEIAFCSAHEDDR